MCVKIIASQRWDVVLRHSIRYVYNTAAVVLVSSFFDVTGDGIALEVPNSVEVH